MNCSDLQKGEHISSELPNSFKRLTHWLTSCLRSGIDLFRVNWYRTGTIPVNTNGYGSRSVFRISKILVRIRILGPVPRTNGCGSVPYLVLFLDAQKFLVLKFYFVTSTGRYFSVLDTFMRKRKNPDTDPYLWLTDPDAESRRPKNIRDIRVRNTGHGNHLLGLGTCWESWRLPRWRPRAPAGSAA